MTPRGFSRFFDAVVIVSALIVISLKGPALVSKVGAWWGDRRSNRWLEKNWDALVADAPTRGNADGARSLVVFFDYQCQFCRELYPELLRLKAGDPSFGWTIRHLPLPLHPFAADASRLATCSQQFGILDVTDSSLATTNGWLRTQSLDDLVRDVAATTAVDEKSLVTCANSAATIEAVAADVALANELGISGTPALVVPGRGVHVGFRTAEEIALLLEIHQ